MRRLLVALGFMGGFVIPALAADYDLPILRGTAVPAPLAPVMTVGPATFTRWSGFYVGGAFSYGSATSDFSTATRPLVHFSLQHLTVEDQAQPSQFEVLGRGSAVAAGVGGFVGYNMQWQDLSRRSLDIAFVSEFRAECRGCVRVLCTRTFTQNG